MSDSTQQREYGIEGGGTEAPAESEQTTVTVDQGEDGGHMEMSFPGRNAAEQRQDDADEVPTS